MPHPPDRLVRYRLDTPPVGACMVDWTDTEFLVVLVFDIAALVIAVWWISGRFTSKMREVEERMSQKAPETAVESEE